MTFPSQVDETHFSDYSEPEWEENLQSLIGSLMGNMTGTINNTGPPTATSNMIAAFNASSNISLAMDNIATTLTNYFRDSSNATVAGHAGQAGQAETYVQVNWLWITLPAFLVIAGLIFLIPAMFESKRQGARIWKTSELALLFHSDQELNALHRSSEMEHVASRVRVKMAKTSSGGLILRREGTPSKST